MLAACTFLPAELQILDFSGRTAVRSPDFNKVIHMLAEQSQTAAKSTT
jgi:hypothetical protein